MENYSFLVLRNPSERTTGKWLRGWQVAQRQLGQVALWEPLPRAGPADLDQLWTRTVLSQAPFRAWNELRLLCWGGSGSGWWQRDAAPPPVDRGWSQCWGQQQLYWVTYFTLCVSIRAWRTYGSRTSLSPVVPRPMHWPVTLHFLGHCQHKYRTYSSKPCIQKKPNKVKETM